jgi:hypothetical protein
MVKIIKDGNEMKQLLLLSLQRFAKETDLEWPYNLIKIHLVPNDVAFLFPKRKFKGGAIKKNCVTCHAINKLRKHNQNKLPKECNRILEQKSN